MTNLIKKVRKKLIKLTKVKTEKMLGMNFLQEAFYCCRLPYGRRRSKRGRAYKLASDGGGDDPNYETTTEEETPGASNRDEGCNGRTSQITKKYLFLFFIFYMVLLRIFEMD
jgi:hypothetical protein